MPGDAPRPSLRSLEPEVRRLWAARRLPPKGGVIGRGDGPRVRQIEGTFVPGDAPALVAHRAVLADVDARYLSLSGRNAIGTLRHEAGGPGGPFAELEPVLESLGIWTGGSGEHPWESSDQRTAIQGVLARLAHRGILVGRDGPLRICLSCRVPRTPERIIYQKEIGDTYLVRFPLAGSDPPVEALVWVDAPWRLLGASALLVHPDLTYVVAEYRRRGASVLILVSRGALDRLRAWLTDAELVVREERPGRDWVGRPYSYPLRHEFPIGGSLDPPAGTIQADTGVGDSGTGVVPLVPGHGPTDAEIAARLGIAGWPLLTPRGILDASLMHKYAGLDVETANEFVCRDLTDGGAVLARLRVVRGVPYCALCGHRIVWAPGRAWCLEPASLPPDQRERYARLLPHDRPISQIEVSRWPVSETTPTRDAGVPTLLECARCERLEAPDAPHQCPCGGTRRPVARRLLPEMAGAIAAWCRNEPIAPTDLVRIYANERRRVPSLVHSLTAMTGVDAATADFGLTLAPTVSRVDLPKLVETHGADAVRSAFVRTSPGDGDTANFEQRCLQERERLARLLDLALGILSLCDAALVREGAQPPDRGARDLEEEDRAVLARWARAHLQVFAAYDRWDAAGAHRRLFRFLEQELPRYLELVGPRLRLSGTPATKRASLRTLLYLIRSSAVALAPIAPFTAETVQRRYLQEPRSLFEGIDLVADRGLVDDAACAAWDRWLAIVQALDRFRHAHHIGAGVSLETAVVSVADEDVAEKLRAERPTIERLGRVGRLDVASPKVPWEGRRRQVMPVDREIQRAYPALATQIIHLLQHLPPRTGAETTAKALTLFVNGAPHTITPEMVSTLETLPENFVPTPFALGEMFVRIPKVATDRPEPPPLSPDAFWLVRRVAHRLATARAEEDETYRAAIVVAVDPLASELREKAEPIARYLGIEELRVEEEVAEALPPDRVTGRTHTGARWWVAVPGLRGRRRPTKRRSARSDGRRVRAPMPAPPSEEVDYGDEKVIAEAEAVRGLGQELDTLLEAPVLGPTKVQFAWESGLRSVDQFRAAPFDQVAALPGYGRPIAVTLWAKFGKTPPGPSPRSHVREGAVRASGRTGRPAPRTSRKQEAPTEPPTGPAIASVPPARERLVPAPSPAPARAAPPPVAVTPETPPQVPPPPAAEIEPEALTPPPEITPIPGVDLTASGEGPVAPETPARPEEKAEETPEPSPPPEEEAPTAENPASTAPTDEAIAGSRSEETVTPTPVTAEPTGPAETAPTEGVAFPDATVTEPPATEAAAHEPDASERSVGPGPEEVPPATVPESVAAMPVPAEPEEGPEAPDAAPGNGEADLEPPAVPPLPVPEEPAAPPEETVVGTAEVPASDAPTPAGEVAEPPGTEPPSEPLAEVADTGSAPEPAAPEPVPPTAEVPVLEPVAVAPAPETSGSAPPPEAMPTPVEGDQPGPLAVPEPRREVAIRESAPPLVLPSPAVPAPRPGYALSPPASEPGPGAPEPSVSEPISPIGPPPPPPVIAPPPPAPAPEAVEPPAQPPGPPSGIELDSAPTLFGALQPFLDATAAGHRGLAIVRELPERIRTHVGPRPVDVLWLSNLERNRTLRPSDLGEILRRIQKALSEDGVTAFFIEGVEYLVRIHGVDRVVEFLGTVDAEARSHEARVWLHVTAGLLSESDFERIRDQLGASEGPR